jgi:hypothetical protein
LGGVFSPTEAAAVAVLYAFFVATFIYREMSFKLLYSLLIDTAITTGAIGLILGAASAFSAILSFGGVPDQVAEFITGFSSNPLIFLIAAPLKSTGMFVSNNEIRYGFSTRVILLISFNSLIIFFCSSMSIFLKKAESFKVFLSFMIFLKIRQFRSLYFLSIFSFFLY